jgi:hypothetical protein
LSALLASNEYSAAAGPTATVAVEVAVAVTVGTAVDVEVGLALGTVEGVGVAVKVRVAAPVDVGVIVARGLGVEVGLAMLAGVGESVQVAAKWVGVEADIDAISFSPHPAPPTITHPSPNQSGINVHHTRHPSKCMARCATAQARLSQALVVLLLARRQLPVANVAAICGFQSVPSLQLKADSNDARL